MPPQDRLQFKTGVVILKISNVNRDIEPAIDFNFTRLGDVTFNDQSRIMSGLRASSGNQKNHGHQMIRAAWLRIYIHCLDLVRNTSERLMEAIQTIKNVLDGARGGGDRHFSRGVAD